MIGHVIISAFHKGTIFNQGGQTFALMDGQILSRTEYPELDRVWPSGAYGSTSTVMVLPDLSDGYYLRGHGFNSGVDPGISSRTVSSGTLPEAPDDIGTFQTAGFQTHQHSLGTALQNFTFGQPGGDQNPSYPSTGTTTSNAPTSISGATLGPASASALDLSHMKFYPYIRVD